MGRIANPELPDTPVLRRTTGANGGIVGQSVGVSGGRINLQARREAVPVRAADPVVAAISTPATPDDAQSLTWAIDASGFELSSVDAIAQNGKLWKQAESIANIQVGEFFYDAIAKTIQLRSGSDRPFVGGLGIQVLGAVGAIALTHIPDPPIILSQLPLISAEEGEALTWSLSAEGHPTGTLRLMATVETLQPLRSALRPGTAIVFFGIGFRVASTVPSVPEVEGVGQYRLEVELQGKWEYLAQKPFLLKPMFPGSLGASGTGEQQIGDGLCPIPTGQSAGGTYNGPTSIDAATAAGIPWQGPPVLIQIEQDTPPGETSTFAAEVEEVVRIAGGFIDWTGVDGPRFVSIDAVACWEYGVGELPPSQESALPDEGYGAEELRDFVFDPAILPDTLDVSGSFPDTVHQPQVTAIHDEPLVGTGILARYENVRLEGKFSRAADDPDEQEREEDQGDGPLEAPPLFLPRTPVVEVLKEGDPNVSSPPVGATRIKSLSVLFNKSGPSKTQVTTRKEDGVVTREELVTYGYAAIARDLVDNNGNLNGTPGVHWKPVRKWQRNHNFESRYGYGTGGHKTGWELAQLLEESDELETVDLDPTDPEDNDLLQLYKPRKITINERERIGLRSYNADYEDAEGDSSALILVRSCLPDGTLVHQWLNDPTFAPPMYAAQIARESSAIASAPNPDSSADNPLPDLVTGSESWSLETIEVTPGRRDNLRQDTPDRYTVWTKQASADGAQFNNYNARENFKDMSGRPSPAQRKPPLVQVIEQSVPPEPPGGDPGAANTDSATEVLRLLNTPGSTADDPQGGSLNYEKAATLEQALTAARTDLYIQQLGSSGSESLRIYFNPQTRPYDKVVYVWHGERRRRRITGVSFSVRVFPRTSLRGNRVLVEAEYEGTATVSLVRDLDARSQIALTEIALPKPPVPREQQQAMPANEPPPPAPPPLNAPIELGELLGDGVRSRSRGNF